MWIAVAIVSASTGEVFCSRMREDGTVALMPHCRTFASRSTCQVLIPLKQTWRSKHRWTALYNTGTPEWRLQMKWTWSLTFLQKINFYLRWLSHAPFCRHWSVLVCSHSLERCFDDPNISLPSLTKLTEHGADCISFSWVALLKINIKTNWQITSVTVIVGLSYCELYWKSFSVQAE